MELSSKQIIEEFEALARSFKNDEYDCWRNMTFLKKHGFLIEEESVRYKQQAYNDCWLALTNIIDKIKKAMEE